MHTLCKLLGLIFILSLTGIESYVFINEFVIGVDYSYSIVKIVLATFIFNCVMFIFATKYRDVLHKVNPQEDDE